MAHAFSNVYGKPCVSWHFEIEKLEEWIQTLEKMTSDVDFCIDRRNDWQHLFQLKLQLSAARDLWEKESKEQSEQPSADDCMAYLSAYSSSIAKETIQ